MNIRAPGNTNDLFFKMIVVSLAFHLALILMSAVKSLLFPTKTVDWTQSAVRVDLVALPDKNPTEPVQMPEEKSASSPPTKASKPIPVPNKKLSLERIKQQVKEEERKKRLAEIAKEVAEQDRKARQAKVKEILVKGNTISKGSSLSGLAKLEFDEYKNSLHAHVRKNWSLPEWLQNDNLKATVVVQIDYRGVVISRFIEKSSGDPRFDEYAMKAVDDSSPFPEPPPKLTAIMKDEGMVLGFPE